MLFDRLRKGALSFFREEESSSELGPSLEAKQLKELVFRENADVLYAREQPSTAIDQSMFETMFPDFEMDPMSLASGADFLGFFNFFDAPELEGFGSALLDDGVTQADLLQSPTAIRSPASPPLRQPARVLVDNAQLKAAMQKLPVCSHCKRRRIKCDTDLPACHNCQKAHKDCTYSDNALGEDVSRR